MQAVRSPLAIVPVLLVGLFCADFAKAQTNDESVRKSRYRFVETASKTKAPAPVVPVKPERMDQEAELSAPMARQNADAKNPVIRTIYQSQEGNSAAIKRSSLSSRPVKHVMAPQQQIQPAYDEARAEYERLQYEKSLQQPFDPNPVQVIPQDIYKVFPQGSDMMGYSTNFLSGCASDCCDEWSGFCRMKKLDYKCGCGGLKATPGHYGQPWLRGCDNCETTCGSKLRGGKGIQARCGKSCLNKARDRAESRINQRGSCGCKACTTVDRDNSCGCSSNGCASTNVITDQSLVANPTEQTFQVAAPVVANNNASVNTRINVRPIDPVAPTYAPAVSQTVSQPRQQFATNQNEAQPTACGCDECKRMRAKASQGSGATKVAQGFSNLKDALTSKASSRTFKKPSSSSRLNWDELVR